MRLLLLLISPCALSACPDPVVETHDVLILGAGMSGLSAAKTLLEDDDPLDFLILEAQDDRVGGRIRSNDEWFDGVIVEEGANWFSDNTQNPTLDLANEYGVDMFVQDFGNYNTYLFDDAGATLADSQEKQKAAQDMFQAYNCIQKEAAKLLKPNGNFRYDPIMDGVQDVQREICGWEESSSLHYFEDWYTHGYEFAEKDTSMYSYPNRLYFFAKFFFIMDQNGGFEKLPKSFANQFLDCDSSSCATSPYFAFNQRVEKVSYDVSDDEEYPVHVETNFAGGCPSYIFKAKRAISTFSTGVTTNLVEFDPPLTYPSIFQMVDYVKIFYQFDQKFWEETDDNQFIVSLPAEYQEILETQGRCIHWQSLDYSTGQQQGPKQSSPDIAPGSKILFCTLLTEAFQDMLDEASSDELTQEQLEGELLDPLRKVFGTVVDDSLVSVRYPKLNKDPNFYGFYENWQVGYGVTDFYKYHGGILPGSNPLIERCQHNGCTADGSKWTLHISGATSCKRYYGFVRGAFDGGKRSANYIRADIGCGGAGCEGVDPEEDCFDSFVNNGNNGNKGL